MNFDEILKMAEVFAKSNLYFYTTGSAKQGTLKYHNYTVPQCAVIMQKGQELGINPAASLDGISIFKGKTLMSANLLASLVKRSEKYDYKVKKLNPKECILEFFENNDPQGEINFTIEMAKKAGTSNLDKFPEDMLFSRCISRGVKKYCPDVTMQMTVYVHEEIENIDDADETNEELSEKIPESKINKFLDLAEKLNGDTKIWAKEIINSGKYKTKNHGMQLLTEKKLEEYILLLEEKLEELKKTEQNPPIDNELEMEMEDFKIKMVEKASKNLNMASKEHQKFTQASLAKIFKDYHPFLNWLFGLNSTSELTQGDCFTIIDWIGAEEDNDYTPNNEAIEQAKKFVDFISGQEKMDL